jgi:hypothetical protein
VTSWSWRTPRFALLVFAVALAPLCWLGPGTDLDVAAVLDAGRRIMQGSYLASRAPGSPVHETLAGMLDWAFGGWAVNLLSLVSAVVLLVAMTMVAERAGAPRAFLGAAFVAANPWFQIASTSTVDFVAAAALLVCGVVLLRADRANLAGLACGLSIGMRMSGVLLVFAMVFAEATGRDRHRDRALRLLVVAGVVSVIAFLAPFVSADGSLAFARNDFSTGSPLSHVGRAVAKNLALFGPYVAVMLVVALPSLWRLRTRWFESWIVRFAAVGFVLSEALFVRFPWKLGHLFPALVCLALLLVEALRDRPKVLVALVVAQLALGVVNVELLRPDVPNSADKGSLTFRVRPGPLIVDTRCRVDDMDAARDGDIARLETVWNCARPWGSDEEPGDSAPP